MSSETLQPSDAYAPTHSEGEPLPKPAVGSGLLQACFYALPVCLYVGLIIFMRSVSSGALGHAQEIWFVGIAVGWIVYAGLGLLGSIALFESKVGRIASSVWVILASLGGLVFCGWAIFVIMFLAT